MLHIQSIKESAWNCTCDSFAIIQEQHAIHKTEHVKPAKTEMTAK